MSSRNMTPCGTCKEANAVMHCEGCGIPLCRNCLHEEQKKSGYGCAWSQYYCRTCISDPRKNPDALVRDPEFPSRR